MENPLYYTTEKLHIEWFYSMFEAYYDSSYIFTGESHDFWECLFVMSGTVEVSADDRVYILKPNQIIFHKPMELHKFNVESAEGTELFIFSFQMQGDLAGQLENKVYKLSESQRKTMYALIDYVREQHDMQKSGVFDHPSKQSLPNRSMQAQRLQNQAAQVKKTQGKGVQTQKAPTLKAPLRDAHGTNTDYRIVQSYISIAAQVPEFVQMITSYTYLLFLSLISNGHVADQSTEPNALLFREAVNFLNDQITGQPSVAEVSEACNTSPASLQRVFHKYAGMSVHKFMLKLKIISATELLREGVNVTEAAERLGFSSQAYFSNCYERETGRRPSAVR